MRLLLVLSLIVGIGVACKKEEKAEPAGGEAAEAPAAEAREEKAAPAAPAEPYKGEITQERMQAAKDGVKPFMKWDEAEAHLLSQVGEPMSVEDGTYEWYLKDGDTCHILSVEKTDKGEVGGVSLGGYDKMMKSQYSKCEGDGADGAAGPDLSGIGRQAAPCLECLHRVTVAALLAQIPPKPRA